MRSRLGRLLPPHRMVGFSPCPPDLPPSLLGRRANALSHARMPFQWFFSYLFFFFPTRLKIAIIDLNIAESISLSIGSSSSSLRLGLTNATLPTFRNIMDPAPPHPLYKTKYKKHTRKLVTVNHRLVCRPAPRLPPTALRYIPIEDSRYPLLTQQVGWLHRWSVPLKRAEEDKEPAQVGEKRSHDKTDGPAQCVYFQ